MIKTNRIRTIDFWIALVLITIAIGTLNFYAQFRSIDFRMMDWRSTQIERQASGDLVLVEMDSQSIKEFGVWPWPRSYFALAIDQLNQYQAKRIFIDIDFSSSSSDLQDQSLAWSIEQSKVPIILPAFTQEDASGNWSLTQALPMFAENSSLGSANISPEPDGLVRQLNPFSQDPMLIAPNVVMLMLDGMTSSDPFFIDFSISPSTIPRISMADLIAGRFNPNLFADKVVIIGASAIELGDIKAVPNYFVLPGATILALAYETIVQERQLYFVEMHYQLIAILLLAFTLGIGFKIKSWRLGIFLVLGCVLSIETIALVLQTQRSIVFPTFALHLLCLFALIQQVISRLKIEQILSFRHLIAQRNAEAWSHTIVMNSSEGIVRTELDGSIIECNARIMDMLQLEHEPNSSDKIDDILELEHLAENTIRPQKITLNTQAGMSFTFEYSRQLVKLDNKTQVAYLVRDITQQTKYEQQLHHQVNHDHLTGIANRGQIELQSPLVIQSAKLQSANFAVVMLDLDNFKDVNDALGHNHGDLLLQQVAQKLQTVPGTELIARLGGDEFVLIFSPSHDLSLYAEQFKKLQKIFAQRFKIHDIDLSISASLGIAYYPQHGEDFETLLKHADLAMYQAKKNMQFSCVFDQQYQQATLRRLMLFGDLRDAVNGHQIQLNYQPKIDIASRKVIGAEVLARWHHPQLGPISPDEFVGVAEHTGLIQGLSFYIIEQAIAQAQLWQSQGININIAVNLSPQNLLDVKLVDYFRQQFAAAPLALQNFSVEVTETVVMTNSAKCIETLGELRKLGLKVSIDDFGTGHSSLQYLDKLPVDELKIDRSFLLNLLESPSQQTIVKTVIDLAHSLNMQVVCEGVEDEVTLASLETFGADIAQGYLFSPPQASEAFLSWVINQQRKFD
ncbi:EAL domain-containing protein [Alginatibacterium sediminis]|uniref:EAL domain-containing protein n=1 Tax=Alginatibacterium sediminis TaxID=2164068 RepID=A0A420E7B8_9ALTE|nr:EAL domain-containing protein [Alginatibacterium sediminis]RKF14305.1 EAL domain-containing protein [Alginatibacterium sediminis]